MQTPWPNECRCSIANPYQLPYRTGNDVWDGDNSLDYYANGGSAEFQRMVMMKRTVYRCCLVILLPNRFFQTSTSLLYDVWTRESKITDQQFERTSMCTLISVNTWLLPVKPVLIQILGVDFQFSKLVSYKLVLIPIWWWCHGFSRFCKSPVCIGSWVLGIGLAFGPGQQSPIKSVILLNEVNWMEIFADWN